MKLLPAFLFFLLACNQNNNTRDIVDEGNQFSDADKIVYRDGNGSRLSNINCNISVTPEEITLEMDVTGGNGELKKKYPFTRKGWDKLIASFDGLRIKGKALEDCMGGGHEGLTFYQENNKLISADNFGCGDEYRNFSGADIDLRYLIKDFDELKASLEKEYEQKEAKERKEDREYSWTTAEKEQYREECLQRVETAEKKPKDADAYCWCMFYRMQENFPTKKLADKSSSDKIESLTIACSFE